MARSATFSAQPDAAALLAQAEYETGLHDFGDGQFRGPLDALVRFLNAAGGQTPMECESLLVYDLRNAYPTMFSKVPYGHPWAEEGSSHEYYASHRQFLQHLQFGGPRRRWVLKGVEHQFRLSALLAAYPDAKLVWPRLAGRRSVTPSRCTCGPTG